MKGKLFAGVLFFLIFSAVAVVLSLLMGFFWRQPAVILLASAVLSIILFRRFRFSVDIPPAVLLLALLVYVLEVHPLLLIHPFLNASADPAPTIATTLITDTIPSTYAPYSDIAFTYQLGFPLFSRLILDLLPAVPPFLITWAVAGVFAALQIIMLYAFAFSLTRSQRRSIIACFLFLGTKTIFQSMYYGEYTWLMGTTFFLAAFAAFREKSPLMYLFFPTILITHPAVGLNSLLFLAVYAAFFRESLAGALKLACSSALAVPSLAITYTVAASNALSGFGTFTPHAIPNALLPLPLWVGAVPVSAAAVTLLYGLRRRSIIGRFEQFLLLFLAIAVAIFAVAGAGVSEVVKSKIVDIIAISAVMLGSSGLAALASSRKRFLLALVLIVIVSLAFFFTSGYLTRGRMGSKISQEEADFAFAFKEFDPSLKKTLFLSKGGPKMAEYAHKIPYDVRQDHFISVAGHIAVRGEAWEAIVEEHRRRSDILSRRCTECLEGIEVDYIVVNTGEFPLLGREPLMARGTFVLYGAQ